MRVLIIFELFIMLAFVWLLVNIIRYSFFKSSKGGGVFGLSDMWLKEK